MDARITPAPRRRGACWILDVDGTLLHLPVDIGLVRQELRRMFLAHGVDLPFRPLLVHLSRAVEQAAGGDAATAESMLLGAYGVLERHEAGSVERATPCGGAREFVAWLGRDPASVASNSAASPVERALDRLGLRPANLRGIVGRTVGLRPKPDPAPVLSAAGVLPGDLLVMVGDRPADMAAARAAEPTLRHRGCRLLALGLRGRLEGEEALRRAGADEVFGDLTELMQWWERGGG